MPERNQKLEAEWIRIRNNLKVQFGKKPDLNGVLFIIGMRELGQVKTTFSKEEKQDLMHIAVCKLLSSEGYYEYDGKDEEGWPHWTPVKMMPKLSVKEQELKLKYKIVEYFEQL